MRHYELSLPRLALGAHGVFLTALMLSSFGLELPIIRPMIVFLVFTFVPGALVLTVVDIPPRLDARWLTYAAGTSLLLILLTAGSLNLFALTLGFSDPLATLPLTVTFTALNLGLVGIVSLTKPDTKLSVTLPDIDDLSPAVFALLSIPPATVLSIWYLNVHVENLPLLLVLSGLSCLPLIAIVGGLDERLYPLAVWTSALAVLYHKSLWKLAGFSGQGSVVRFYRLKEWNPAVNGLLEHGALFPVYARLSGIGILTQMEVVNPILISAFIPVVIFLTFRRIGDETDALLGALLFVFAHPFYLQYPTAGRAATPVLFLALLGAAMSDDDLSMVAQKLLVLAFALGIVTTHYGTSYVVMFALFSAVAVLLGYYWLDCVVDLFRRREWPRRELSALIPPRSRFGLLTPSFTGYYTAASVAWYLYTFQERQFKTLVEFVLKTVSTFTGDQPFGGGSTANRLQSDYGAVSIMWSKRLYMTIALLMVLGFLAVYIRRFLRQDRSSELTDEYLALASTLFAVFTGTLLIPGSWGGGRPMMIVFSFTAIFAVLGVRAIISSTRHLVNRVRTPGDHTNTISIHPGAPFAVLLTVFLLINSGVVAAVALGGTAPSNVPIEAQQTDSYRATDIQTHIWLVNHRNQSYRIFGDRIVYAQVDVYSPQISAGKRSPTVPGYQIKPVRDHLTRLKEPGVEQGYVLLMGANVVENRIKIRHLQWESIDQIRPEISNRSRIYTTGRSRIYFWNSTATSG